MVMLKYVVPLLQLDIFVNGYTARISYKNNNNNNQKFRAKPSMRPPGAQIRPNFARFWPQKFFSGRQPPNFGSLIFKNEHCFDDAAKFRGHRPTELGRFHAEKNTKH